MNLDLVIFHKNWPTHGEIFAIEVKILVYVILSHSVKLKNVYIIKLGISGATQEAEIRRIMVQS
jgi:hypothetical protein